MHGHDVKICYSFTKYVLSFLLIYMNPLFYNAKFCGHQSPARGHSFDIKLA